jgi:uncharacterized protein
VNNVAFPPHFDTLGHTAGASDDDHVRQMLEQLLFTNPGERVNRPDFGSGLLRMVFSPTSPEVAAALQFTIRGAVERWLGDVIEIRDLEVTSSDSTLSVVVSYSVRRTGVARTDTFSRGVT